MSVNQRRTNSTPSSLIRFRTSLRAFGSLVALSGVSTCVAIESLPKNGKTPSAEGARGLVALDREEPTTPAARAFVDLPLYRKRRRRLQPLAVAESGVA